MATTEVPTSEDPNGELAQLISDGLERQYDGNQSALKRDCEHVSQPTISRLLQDPGSRDWFNVHEVVVTLGLDVNEAERLWLAARRNNLTMPGYLIYAVQRAARLTFGNSILTSRPALATSP